MDTSHGQTLRISYDDRNRVSAFLQKAEGSAVKTRYLYGQPEKQQSPGLIYGLEIDGKERMTCQYDTLARVREKVLHLDNKKTHTTAYTYLPGRDTGTTTTLVESLTNGADTLSYAYDEVGNIKTISENGILKATYHYDALNRLIREDSVREARTVCYTYDPGGNMTGRCEYPYTDPKEEVGTARSRKSYTYGNSIWRDQLTAYEGEAITYDAIGNPLTYRGMQLNWQRGRRLMGISTDDHKMTCTYNSGGIRTSKTADGKHTRYYLNGSRIVAMKSGEDMIHFLYDENGNLFSMRLNGTDYYYLYNLQNDIIGLLDSRGNKVVSYRYDSWGCRRELTDTTSDHAGSKNPFRYRGYYLDEETGFYYVSSRYYDPEIGRWINADDAIAGVGGDIRGYNLFAYCMNDPVNMSDHTGHWPQWIKNAASAVVNAVKKAVTVVVNTVKSAVSSASNILKASSNSLSKKGEPRSSQTLPNPDGTPKQKRWYGPDGNPERDRDYNHPGNMPFPHDHEWKNGERGKEHLPPDPSYKMSWESVIGAGLVVICTIGIIAVAADDLTGIGVADDFLFGPLGAGVGEGLIMIFG